MTACEKKPRIPLLWTCRTQPLLMLHFCIFSNVQVRAFTHHPNALFVLSRCMAAHHRRASLFCVSDSPISEGTKHSSLVHPVVCAHTSIPTVRIRHIMYPHTHTSPHISRHETLSKNKEAKWSRQPYKEMRADDTVCSSMLCVCKYILALRSCTRALQYTRRIRFLRAYDSNTPHDLTQCTYP